MNRLPSLKLVMIWLAFSVGAATVVIIFFDFPKWHGLAQRAVETNGKVTAKEPANHMSIRYSYRVGEQTYTGTGQSGDPNPEFDKINVGDSIKVFYDAENPEVSSADSPDRESSTIMMVVLFAMIAAPIIGFVGLYEKGWLPLSDQPRS